MFQTKFPSLAIDPTLSKNAACPVTPEPVMPPPLEIQTPFTAKQPPEISKPLVAVDVPENVELAIDPLKLPLKVPLTVEFEIVLEVKEAFVMLVPFSWSIL